MGKIDIGINEWLKNKERFADLFNGLVFEGKQMVKKEDLTLVSGESKKIIRHKTAVEKHRDVIMVWKGITLAFLALESQEKIDYQMPVRSMLYDALSYKSQADDIWNNLTKEEQNQVTVNELFSRYRDCDKLAPVITLVLYYNDKEEWTGPTHLYDMFDLPKEEGMCDVIKEFVPDYKINLVELDKINNKKFRTDLQTMFGMVKYRKSKEMLRRYIDEHQEYFSSVDQATLDAGLALLGFKGRLADRLERLYESGIERKIRSKEGKWNMCKAIEDMMNDKWNEGRQEGRQEGYIAGESAGIIIGELKGTVRAYKDCGLSREEAIKRVMDMFSLTEMETTECVEKYWG